MISRRLKATGRFILVVIAVIFVLTEEFIWASTGRMMALLGRWEPVARVERSIARLPPYPAMVLFIFPWAVILPVKLIAFYDIAMGQFVRGVVLFTIGEVIGLAILARLYAVCRPALLQLVWFTAVERFVVACKNWAHRMLEHLPPYRRARAFVSRHVSRGSDRLQRLWDYFVRRVDTPRRPTSTRRAAR